MSQLSYQDEVNNRIVFRHTPWEERVLGVGSREILSIDCEEESALDGLIASFDRQLQCERIGFCSCRVAAHENRTIQALQHNGFRYIETSLVVTHNQVQQYTPDSRLAKPLFVRPATDSDREMIKEISASSFDYGRMFEDPDVSKEIAQQRQCHWVGDLFDQGKNILVHEGDTGVVSFMAYDEANGGEIELILGGSQRGCGLSSVWFWNAIMLRFKQEKKTRITTVISCANYGVINLYVHCGFKVDHALIGLNKHYRYPSEREP